MIKNSFFSLQSPSEIYQAKIDKSLLELEKLDIKKYEKWVKIIFELDDNYTNLGNLALAQVDFKTALEKFKSCLFYLTDLSEFLEYDSWTRLERCYTNLAITYFRMGDIVNSSKFAEKALDYLNEIPDSNLESELPRHGCL